MAKKIEKTSEEVKVEVTSEEKRIAKLVELKAAAEAGCKSYNELFAQKKFDEAVAVGKKIKENVDEYTALVRKMCFDSCYATDDPMMEAIKRISFVTIAVKDERTGEGDETTRGIVDKNIPINLRDLHKHKADGIGKDSNWIYMAEKLNMLMTVRTGKELHIPDEEIKKINDSYAMAEVARKIEMGETPTSNTQLLKAAQTLVNAMIGEEFKVTSKDVAWLLATFTKKSNKTPLTVICANHKAFVQNVAEMCHAIVLKKAYGVDYKKLR